MMKHTSTMRRSRPLIAVYCLVAFWIVLQGPVLAAVTSLNAKKAWQLIEARGRSDPAFVVIDMRTPGEFQQGYIAGAVLIDYYRPTFKAELDRLDRGRTYLIYCRSGNRSGKALKLMVDMGFGEIFHLEGGILDWRAQGLPLVRPDQG